MQDTEHPVRWPSVTRILGAQGFYRQHVPTGEATAAVSYLSRGVAVHKACELDDQGILDESSVVEEVRPYLEAHRAARSDLGIKGIMWETRLSDEPHGYTGKPDLVAWVHDDRTVIDWKSGNLSQPDPTTVIQLAAYEWLVVRTLFRSHQPRAHLGLAATLQYRPNGTYIFTRFEADELAAAWDQFLGALRNYHWRARHGRLSHGNTKES